jgi:hypothetical protein
LKIFQKEVSRFSTMEEDKNVQSPSKKRSSRSWKRVASQVTDSERMKKTHGSGRDRKEPGQESGRRRDDKAQGGRGWQEGNKWIPKKLSDKLCIPGRSINGPRKQSIRFSDQSQDREKVKEKSWNLVMTICEYTSFHPLFGLVQTFPLLAHVEY